MAGIAPPYRAGRGGPVESRTKAQPRSTTGPTPPARIVKAPVGNVVPKGAKNVHTPVGNELLNIRGLQYFLRNQGYHVTVDGKLGPETKQALHSAIGSGTIKNPTPAETAAVKGVKGPVLSANSFNHMVAAAGNAPYRPLTGTGPKNPGLLTKSGSVNTAGLGGGGNGQGTLNVGPTQKALNASTGKAIPASESLFGTMFDVNKDAAAQADQQYGSQISDANLQLQRDPLQNAQNEKDVQDWYNQVLGAQHAAGNADTAATKAGVDSQNAITQALVASLGGSSNQGAGEAAAAGLNGSNTLQAMGLAQSNLDNELAPILQAQAAQQKVNQAHVDQAKLQTDQQALSDLQGQRGNAEVAAQMQLQGSNNSLAQARQSALQNILQYNNTLGQQKFQNQLGLSDAEIAAMMNGVTIAKNNAEANYYNARAAHAGQGAGNTPGQLNEIQSALIGALGSKGLIVSPGSGVYKLAPGVTPGQVQSFAQRFVAPYGNVPGTFLPGTLNSIQGY